MIHSLQSGSAASAHARGLRAISLAVISRMPRPTSWEATLPVRRWIQTWKCPHLFYGLCTKYPSWWRPLSSCFKSCHFPRFKPLFPAYFCWKPPPHNNFPLVKLAGEVWAFPRLFNKEYLHHLLKAPDKSPFVEDFCESLCQCVEKYWIFSTSVFERRVPVWQRLKSLFSYQALTPRMVHGGCDAFVVSYLWKKRAALVTRFHCGKTIYRIKTSTQACQTTLVAHSTSLLSLGVFRRPITIIVSPKCGFKQLLSEFLGGWLYDMDYKPYTGHWW